MKVRGNNNLFIDEDFKEIGRTFDISGNVITGKIERAECRMFDYIE